MSARVRPDVANPRSSAGNVCSRKNSALLNGCTRKPSATSPATSVIPSPTPATKMRAVPTSLGSGVKKGVINVWR